MKCPNCGANIRNRDEFCAWCGAVNEQARRHVQILNRYRTQTSETRQELETQTLKRVPVFIRLLVIALLLVGFALLIYVREASWSWSYRLQKIDSGRNAAAYTAALDALIRDRDHLGYQRFMNAHNLSVYGGYDDYPYRKYRMYDQLNSDFCYMVNQTMQLYPFDQNSYESETRTVQRVADYCNSFYLRYETAFDNDPYAVDDALTGDMIPAAEDMEAQLRAILVAYLHLDAETADGIAALTDAGRKLAIEQAYLAWKEGAE